MNVPYIRLLNSCPVHSQHQAGFVERPQRVADYLGGMPPSCSMGSTGDSLLPSAPVLACWRLCEVVGAGARTTLTVRPRGAHPANPALVDTSEY